MLNELHRGLELADRRNILIPELVTGDEVYQPLRRLPTFAVNFLELVYIEGFNYSQNTPANLKKTSELAEVERITFTPNHISDGVSAIHPRGGKLNIVTKIQKIL